MAHQPAASAPLPSDWSLVPHEKENRHRITEMIGDTLWLFPDGGLELLQWLHTHETWCRVPRVVLTSSTASSDVATAYAFGAAAYLVKPVEVHELRTMAKAMSDFWRLAQRPVLPREQPRLREVFPAPPDELSSRRHHGATGYQLS